MDTAVLPGYVHVGQYQSMPPFTPSLRKDGSITTVWYCSKTFGSGSYVSENKISPDELIRLIGTVYNSLSVPTTSGVKEQIPAVPIKRSVFPDYIICLEDGKKLKMLKRHLQASYGMTPEEYRRKWGLPSHYPMVAPNYTVRRSELAREIGLGRDIMSTATKSGDEGATDPALPDKPQGRRRGRKKAVH